MLWQSTPSLMPRDASAMRQRPVIGVVVLLQQQVLEIAGGQAVRLVDLLVVTGV